MRPTSNGKTTCVEKLCVGNAAPCLWHSGPGSLELESILMIDLTSDFFHPRKILRCIPYNSFPWGKTAISEKVENI